MSALNIAETKALREVMTALHVLGNEENLTAEKRKQIAKIASDKVKTVVTMKGHYSK